MSDDIPTLNELVAQVPESLRARFEEAVSLIDAFCAEQLNEEYKMLCREMAVPVFQAGTSANRGKVAGWASGIVYAVGWVNFLTDPSQHPHMTREDIAKGFGISSATMQNRFREIREGLELIPFHPGYSLPSGLSDNPLVWMLEVDGFLLDVRKAPYEVQQQALEEGLIPYIPDDQARGDESIAAAMLLGEDNRKVIVPGERIELKLSRDERQIIFDLTYVEDEILKQIRNIPPDQSAVPLTLDELDLLAGSVAAEANHTDDRRLQKKLDRIHAKVERLLETYTDEPRLV